MKGEILLGPQGREGKGREGRVLKIKVGSAATPSFFQPKEDIVPTLFYTWTATKIIILKNIKFNSKPTRECA